jgi:hypothetical protein
LEVISQRSTYDSNRETQFSANNFVSLVEGNLPVLLGLLAEDCPTTEIVATATFLGFDDVSTITDHGTLTFQNATRVNAPTIRFDAPGEDHGGEYTNHVDAVNALVRPLWQSSGRINYPETDHNDPLPVPNYSFS